MLAISHGQGILVVHSADDLSLHAFTINGRHRKAVDTTERLSALCISPDGRFLLSAGAKGVISLVWLHSFQVSNVSLGQALDLQMELASLMIPVDCVSCISVIAWFTSLAVSHACPAYSPDRAGSADHACQVPFLVQSQPFADNSIYSARQFCTF